MARGPVPKSAASKKARGNPGKRAIAAAPPVPSLLTPGDTTPNTKLRPAGLHVWKTLAPELKRLNILRPTDSGALSRYCDDVATYWDVSQKLRVQGMTYVVESNHGTYNRINPLFAVQERLSARLIAMEDRFGLSPQARQQLMVRAAQLAAQGQGTLALPDPAQPHHAPDAGPINIFGPAATAH